MLRYSVCSVSHSATHVQRLLHVVVCEPRVATQFVLYHVTHCYTRSETATCCGVWTTSCYSVCSVSHSATHVQRLLHVVVCEPQVATQFVLYHTLLHTFRDCYMLWSVNHELLLSLFCITLCYTRSETATCCGLWTTSCYSVCSVSRHTLLHTFRDCYMLWCVNHELLLSLFCITLCYTRSETATCCSVWTTSCYSVLYHVTLCYTRSETATCCGLWTTSCYSVLYHVTLCYTRSETATCCGLWTTSCYSVCSVSHSATHVQRLLHVVVCEPRVATQFCITSHSATHVQRLLHVVVCEPRVATQFVLYHTLLHTFRDCYMLWSVNHELLLSSVSRHTLLHTFRDCYMLWCVNHELILSLFCITLCYTRSETATCCGLWTTSCYSVLYHVTLLHTFRDCYMLWSVNHELLLSSVSRHTLLHTFRDCYMLWCVNHELLLSSVSRHTLLHTFRDCYMLWSVNHELLLSSVSRHTLLHTFRDCYMLWSVNHELLLSSVSRHTLLHTFRDCYMLWCVNHELLLSSVSRHTLLHTFRDCYMLWSVNHELLLSLTMAAAV